MTIDQSDRGAALLIEAGALLRLSSDPHSHQRAFSLAQQVVIADALGGHPIFRPRSSNPLCRKEEGTGRAVNRVLAMPLTLLKFSLMFRGLNGGAGILYKVAIDRRAIGRLLRTTSTNWLSGRFQSTAAIQMTALGKWQTAGVGLLAICDTIPKLQFMRHFCGNHEDSLVRHQWPSQESQLFRPFPLDAKYRN